MNPQADGPALACDEIARRLARLEHALRTPVGTLTAALELLKLAADAAGRDNAVQVMERQVRQLTTQLEQLHDISRDLAAAVKAQP